MECQIPLFSYIPFPLIVNRSDNKIRHGLQSTRSSSKVNLCLWIFRILRLVIQTLGLVFGGDPLYLFRMIVSFENEKSQLLSYYPVCFHAFLFTFVKETIIRRTRTNIWEVALTVYNDRGSIVDETSTSVLLPTEEVYYRHAGPLSPSSSRSFWDESVAILLTFELRLVGIPSASSSPLSPVDPNATPVLSDDVNSVSATGSDCDPAAVDLSGEILEVKVRSLNENATETEVDQLRDYLASVVRSLKVDSPNRLFDETGDGEIESETEPEIRGEDLLPPCMLGIVVQEAEGWVCATEEEREQWVVDAEAIEENEETPSEGVGGPGGVPPEKSTTTKKRRRRKKKKTLSGSAIQTAGKKRGKKSHIVYIDREDDPDADTEEEEGELVHGQLAVLSVVKFDLKVLQFNRLTFERARVFENPDLRTTILEPNIDAFHELWQELYQPLVARRGARPSPEDLRRLDEKVMSIIGRFSRRNLRPGEKVFARTQACSASVGAFSFFFGGTDRKSDLMDIIRVNPARRTVDIFRGLHSTLTPNRWGDQRNRYQRHDIKWVPSMRMISLRGALFLLSPGEKPQPRYRYARRRRFAVEQGPTLMKVQVISKPTTNSIHYGWLKEGQAVRWHPNRGMPTAIDFEVCTIGVSTFYVFGGRAPISGRPNDRLMVGGIVSEHRRGQESHVRLIGVDATDMHQARLREFPVYVNRAQPTWPSPRYGHHMASHSTVFFVFGGVGFNGRVLHDMYRFDTTTRLWTEIDLFGYIPPSLVSFGAFPRSGGFVIQGGYRSKTDRTRPGAPSSGIYVYVFREEKFFVARVPKPTDMPVSPLARQGICVCPSASHLTLLGGINEEGALANEIWFLLNPNDQGDRILLLEHLDEARKTELLTDVQFLVGSGEDLGVLYAHKSILRARCPLLADDVERNGTVDVSQEDDEVGDSSGPRGLKKIVSTLRIGDAEIEIHVVEAFLGYIYTGSVNLVGARRIRLLLAFAEKYSSPLHPHRRNLEMICRKRRKKQYLEMCSEVLHEIESDFSQLSAPTLGEGELESDLTLIFADGEELHVHKVFLVRSPYFKSMLVSNFRESIESRIHFDEFEKEPLLDIVHYLYTDQLRISPDNCIGCLVYSLQFSLPVVSNYCRRMVGAYLTVENCVELLAIAEHYCDATLKTLCIRYVADHYETFTRMAEYQNADLELTSRERAKDLHEKRLKREQKRRKRS